VAFHLFRRVVRQVLGRFDGGVVLGADRTTEVVLIRLFLEIEKRLGLAALDNESRLRGDTASHHIPKGICFHVPHKDGATVNGNSVRSLAATLLCDRVPLCNRGSCGVAQARACGSGGLPNRTR